MQSLRELQQWMRWIVTDPRGVDAALAKPNPDIENQPHGERLQQPPGEGLGWIAEQEPLAKEARLSIYAEAYFLRLLEALTTDFPLVMKIMGEERFRKFVIQYLIAHPSRSTTVSELGRSVAKALCKSEFNSEIPILAEAADLEWNLIEAFYAPVLEPFAIEKLAGVTEAQWAEAKFTLDPSFRFMELKYATDDFWRDREDLELFALEENPRSVYLLRSGSDFFVNRVSTEQKATLTKMQRGLPLGEILSESESAEAVMADFGQWLSLGLIRDIQFMESALEE